MRRLQRRIRQQGTAHKRAVSRFRPAPQPAGTGTGGGAASPAAVGVMPLAEVLVYPEPGGDYATVAYRGLSPIFTPGGEAVPASAPGRWDQLALAGNPHPSALRRWQAPISGR